MLYCDIQNAASKYSQQAITRRFPQKREKKRKKKKEKDAVPDKDNGH
jgi:hypothetical protein